jgi:hypothetical protein
MRLLDGKPFLELNREHTYGYFTFLELPERHVLLYRQTGNEHRGMGLEQTHYLEADDRSNFDPEKSRQLFENRQKMFDMSISHNFTVLEHNGQFIGCGGSRYKMKVPEGDSASSIETSLTAIESGTPDHISLSQGLYFLRTNEITSWQKPFHLLRQHLKTPIKHSVFDGSINLLWSDPLQLFLLYVRHNPSKGKRSLQCYRSRDLISWTRSRVVRMSLYQEGVYCSSIWLEGERYIGSFLVYTSINEKGYPTDFHLVLGSSPDGLHFTVDPDFRLEGQWAPVIGRWGKRVLVYHSDHRRIDSFEIELGF